MEISQLNLCHHLYMGSICSKTGTHSGGHDVVAHILGTSSSGQRVGPQSTSERPDPRTAAADAAERRLKQAQSRGTTAHNPKRGELSAKLEASKAAPRIPEARQEERLVWD